MRRKKFSIILAAIVLAIVLIQSRKPYMENVMRYQDFRPLSKSLIDDCSNPLRPSNESIKYFNTFWQRLDWRAGRLHILKAHYDERISNPNPIVRIIAATETHHIPKIYCVMWVDDEMYPKISIATIHYGWLKWLKLPKNTKQIHTIIVNCPANYGKPKSISLTTDPCKVLGNNLEIPLNKSEVNNKTSNIAVCVRWFIYPNHDMSIRLIEWLEMVRILGADHVYLSDLSIHPNMNRVKQFYTSSKFLTWDKYTLPGDQPNDDPITQANYVYNNVPNEILNDQIRLYDCVYQTMNIYKYLIIMDMDELIIPIRHHTWRELLKNIENGFGKSDSYGVKRYYYLDSDTPDNHSMIQNIPKNLYTMRNIYRREHDNVKSIIRLDRVVSKIYCFKCSNRAITDINQ